MRGQAELAKNIKYKYLLRMEIFRDTVGFIHFQQRPDDFGFLSLENTCVQLLLHLSSDKSLQKLVGT